MSVEIHVRTRGKLRPDPSLDPVLAIFYHVHNDWPLNSDDKNGGGRSDHSLENTRTGVIAIDLDRHRLKNLPVCDAAHDSKEDAQKPSPDKRVPTVVPKVPTPTRLRRGSPFSGSSPFGRRGSGGGRGGMERGRGRRGRGGGGGGGWERRMAVTPTKLFRKKDEELSAKDTSAPPDGSMHLHSTSGQSASGHGESGQGVPSDSGRQGGAGGLGGSQSRGFLEHCGLSQPMEVTYATSEADLLEKLVQLVRRSFTVAYVHLVRTHMYVHVHVP